MTTITIPPSVSGSAGPTPNRNVFSPAARTTATTRPIPTPIMPFTVHFRIEQGEFGGDALKLALILRLPGGQRRQFRLGVGQGHAGAHPADHVPVRLLHP